MKNCKVYGTDNVPEFNLSNDQLQDAIDALIKLKEIGICSNNYIDENLNTLLTIQIKRAGGNVI